jgi:hypothetical protein
MDLALRASGLGNYQLGAVGTPTSRDGDEAGETVLNGATSPMAGRNVAEIVALTTRIRGLRQTCLA